MHELGNEDLPLDQKSQFDAVALSHLRNTTSHDISNSLLRFKTTYHAFKHIEIYYGGKKLQELIRLELRARQLHFAEHYKPVQFITDFENIIDEYKELGTTFDEETLVARFLAAIDCRHVQGHPYAIFYNTILALPQEQRTFQYVKQSFLNIDNSNFKLQFRKQVSERRPLDATSESVPLKRPRFDYTRTTQTEKPRTLAVGELLKKERIHLSELYNEKQRDRLRSMPKDDKRKNQCKKCGTYFHRAENCMFKTPFCYNCYRFGHSHQNCTKGKDSKFFLNNVNFSAPVESSLSKSIFDANTLNSKTIEILFQMYATFIVDSGATHHAVSDQTILFDFFRYTNPIEVRLAINDAPVIAMSTGYGHIVVLMTFGRSKHILKISNVQLVENLNENVLSVRKFNVQFHTSFNLNTNNGSIYSRKARTKIGLIRVTKELYRLSMKICRTNDLFDATRTNNVPNDFATDDLRFNIKTTSLTTPSSENSCKNNSINTLSIGETSSRKTNRNKLRKSRTKLSPEKLRLLESEGEILHNRFGHISSKYLNKLRTAATGLNEFILNKTTKTCLICAQAKMTRKSFTKAREKARHPCEIINTDLIHYSPLAIRTSDEYLLTVEDNYTRYLQVFPMKSKAETFTYLEKALINLKSMFYPQYPFRYLQSDNGPEFINSEVQTILKKFDMQHRKSEPYEHQHNGMIERVHRTVEERIRALLFLAGFPSSYWNIAAYCAVYLYNRTPHAALDFLTPYEKVHSKPPDISNLRIFGSRTAVHDPLIPKGNKTQARALIHYLVGYTATGYLTFDPKTKKTHERCSVKIDESRQYKHDYPNRFKDNLFTQPIDNSNSDTLSMPIEYNIPTATSDNTNTSENEITTNDTNKAAISVSQKNDSDSEYELFETEIEEEIELDTDWDSNQTPISINTCSLSSIYKPEFSENLSQTNVPITYREATTGQDRLKWIPAIKHELNCMTKHNVWTIVPRDKDISVVPVKWVFNIKNNEKFKARLVAIGCRDTEKYRPADKATPTPSSDIIRWLFAHVSYTKKKLVQIDITTAFLHANIDRVKYISIPPGVQGNNKTHVCKLNRALYGLATSPKCWYQAFDAKLRTYGFERNIREPCLYTKKNDSSIIIAVVYVDDVLLTSEDDDLISETITQIANDFEVKNLGFPTKFLGLHLD
jgi:hypothetical protein